MKFIKLLLAILLLILVVPIFSVVCLSFRDTGGEVLKWYRLILVNTNFTDALLLSVYISALSTILSILVSMLLSLSWFHRTQWPFVLLLLLVLGLLPPDIIALSLTKIANSLGFFQANLLLLVVGLSLFCVPYCVLILWGRFFFIKPTLMTAARDLGLHNRSIIMRLVLPLSVPALVNCTILSFLLAFNEFPRTYYLSGSNVLMSEYLSGRLNSGADGSDYAAGSLLIMVTVGVILLLSFCQSYLSNKMESGKHP